MKKFFIAMFCSLMAGTSMAQEQQDGSFEVVGEKVEGVSFWNNWFINASGGAQMLWSDHDRQLDFTDRLAPALDVSFGKWFTPNVGVRLMYSGTHVKGATKPSSLGGETSAHPVLNGAKPDIDPKHNLVYQRFSYANAQLDAMFNVTNIVGGYNPYRVWNCSPYIGLGWAVVWHAPQAHEVTANFGVYNTFKVYKGLALSLDVHTMFSHERFSGEMGGRSGSGILSASAGITYSFARKVWTQKKVVYLRDINAEEQLRELQEENARLRSRNDKLESDVKAAIRAKELSAENIGKLLETAGFVTFPIGKTTLSNGARVTLGLIAEIINKSDSSIKLDLFGSADAGTGSAELNEKLGKERAQVVYDCLVKEFKVDPSRLNMINRAGIENQYYDDPSMSRAVLIRCAK